MDESDQRSRYTTESQITILGLSTDSSKEKIVHDVTERHMVDLTGGTCTCIEDYLFDEPCRHRRKVAKQLTKNESKNIE